VINVGGSKVYPAEVESALLEMEHVADAVVRGEAHAFTGQIVAATVRLTQPELPEAFKLRMRRFLAQRLAPHKVPVRVRITEDATYSVRFKRIRA
jgi:acyl-coenzyme A synthetase/AMP-(fatty) acid ligase